MAFHVHEYFLNGLSVHFTFQLAHYVEVENYCIQNHKKYFFYSHAYMLIFRIEIYHFIIQLNMTFLV